jgi:large subunit ribosomal protein L9
MKVFFLKSVDGCGNYGDIKEISCGYAKNFLIPNGFVVGYNKYTKYNLDNKKSKIDEKIKVDSKRRTAMSDLIEGMKLSFNLKVHDENRVYGSVSADDICNKLKESGVSVSKNQVLIDKPLKTIGNHFVAIKLSNVLRPSLKISIVKTKG